MYKKIRLRTVIPPREQPELVFTTTVIGTAVINKKCVVVSVTVRLRPGPDEGLVVRVYANLDSSYLI